MTINRSSGLRTARTICALCNVAAWIVVGIAQCERPRLHWLQGAGAIAALIFSIANLWMHYADKGARAHSDDEPGAAV